MAKKGFETVQGAALDVIKMQNHLQGEFDRSSKFFIPLGAINKHNIGSLVHADALHDTRQMGTGTGRAFAAERGFPISEFYTVPYQRKPASANARQMGLNYSYERLFVYTSGKKVLALSHIIDHGRTENGPDPDVQAIFDRALVFDVATNTMKYRESNGQQSQYVELGQNIIQATGEFEQKESYEEGEVALSYADIYSRIAGPLIATEFQELRDTPIFNQGDKKRDRFLGRVRELGQIARHGEQQLQG